MIEEAERLILRASELGSIGRYQLEAALQSAHVIDAAQGRTIGSRWCSCTMHWPR
jgi:RNA polymerase sigma-70 factor (ECF subfamily)